MRPRPVPSTTTPRDPDRRRRLSDLQSSRGNDHAQQRRRSAAAACQARSRVRQPAISGAATIGVVYNLYDGDQQEISTSTPQQRRSHRRGPQCDHGDRCAVAVPDLRWNGSHYGLLWYENLRGEPEVPTRASCSRSSTPPATSCARRAAASTLRRLAQCVVRDCAGLDGTIGSVQLRVEHSAFSHVVYYRLTEGGDTVSDGRHHHTSDTGERDRAPSAHHQPVRGAGCGIATAGGVWFQRSRSRTLARGGPALLGSYSGSTTAGVSGILDAAPAA